MVVDGSNIKMDFKKIACYGLDCFQVAQDVTLAGSCKDPSGFIKYR
jgi:hypothetical protein